MNFKTTRKTLTLTFCLLLTLGAVGHAQQVANVRELIVGERTQDLSKLPKMERDIVILQNVLNDLISSDRNLSYSARSAKGMYIPGKGVIFNVTYGSKYGNIVFADNMTIVENLGDLADDLDDKNRVQTTEEKNKSTQEQIERLSKEFLVNYGSILSELKAGEKVMLNVEYAQLKPVKKEETGVSIRPSESATAYAQTIRLAYAGKSSNHRMTSYISYNDIEGYLNGKLSLDQAESKVSTTLTDESKNEAPDAKIMAGILDDLFQSNFDGKFRRSRKTTWTYFEGFGLMYDLNMSNSSGLLFGTNAQFVARTPSSDAKPPKEDKKNIEEEKEAAENLDKLIGMAKESLITYGRTLRSVKSEEVVILNINLGGSYGRLKLPRSVRLQVTKAQIEAYSRGQKSLEQLKQEIDTKLLKASASNFPTVQGYVNQAQSIYSTTPSPSGRVVIGQKAKGQN